MRFNSNLPYERLKEQLNEYIIGLEQDAQRLERLGDTEAMYLLKDVKWDIEQMLMEGK